MPAALVVDRAGRLVGIVSPSDVARFVQQALAAQHQAVAQQAQTNQQVQQGASTGLSALTGLAIAGMAMA